MALHGFVCLSVGLLGARGAWAGPAPDARSDEVALLQVALSTNSSARRSQQPGLSSVSQRVTGQVLSAQGLRTVDTPLSRSLKVIISLKDANGNLLRDSLMDANGNLLRDQDGNPVADQAQTEVKHSLNPVWEDELFNFETTKLSINLAECYVEFMVVDMIMTEMNMGSVTVPVKLIPLGGSSTTLTLSLGIHESMSLGTITVKLGVYLPGVGFYG